ncbi:MAG: molybdenum cofactor guanylyltransferase [Methylococcus sp.]|nr:molybdenum cofactor guanylyltransferase [Methylococcus sp.]
MIYPSTNISGCVLAGGRGRRMGGMDKGLIEFRGRPLVAYALDALREIAAPVAISANRNREVYADFGCPVIVDAYGDFDGPLAGLLAAMAWAETEFVLTLPCDMPLVSGAMLARLVEAQKHAGCNIAVAHDGARLQPLILLVRRSLLPDLEAYLKAGERKVEFWLARHRMQRIDYSDAADIFANVNSPEELRVLEAHSAQPSA